MLLPNAPSLLNFLVVNATLDKLNFAHKSCLTDNYYGTYGDQSLFMLGSDSSCDLSELKFGTGSGLSLVPVHPYHELLFVKKTEVEGARADEYNLLGGLERLVAHTADNTPITPDMQQPLNPDAPVYTIPYYTESSALITITPHFLPHIDKALPHSYKAYALPRLPLPLRPVPGEAKERIVRWTDSVQHDPEIALLIEGLSISELREDIRYLTGENPKSPILSRSSFSEGARLAAEWILEEIEETGADCELKSFLPGFSPNVIW